MWLLKSAFKGIGSGFRGAGNMMKKWFDATKKGIGGIGWLGKKATWFVKRTVADVHNTLAGLATNTANFVGNRIVAPMTQFVVQGVWWAVRSVLSNPVAGAAKWLVWGIKKWVKMGSHIVPGPIWLSGLPNLALGIVGGTTGALLGTLGWAAQGAWAVGKDIAVNIPYNLNEGSQKMGGRATDLSKIVQANHTEGKVWFGFHTKNLAQTTASVFGTATWLDTLGEKMKSVFAKKDSSPKAEKTKKDEWGNKKTDHAETDRGHAPTASKKEEAPHTEEEENKTPGWQH